MLFYKFKTIALKTEKYFNELSYAIDCVDEVIEPDDIKSGVYSNNDSPTDFLDDTKEEDNISENSSEYQSDNKYLIVVEEFNDANLSDKSEENGECQMVFL